METRDIKLYLLTFMTTLVFLIALYFCSHFLTKLSYLHYILSRDLEHISRFGYMHATLGMFIGILLMLASDKIVLLWKKEKGL